MNDSLQVSELFYSIQGESTRAGLPCAFIRLSGCNLRCAWCDSRYTWEEPGRATTTGEILAWLSAYHGAMVEITGGEPLLQEAVYPLMERLLATGHEVLLETNGSLAVDRVPAGVSIILDIKCPGSGMAEHNLAVNMERLAERSRQGCRDEIKFVIGSEQDFTWAAALTEERGLSALCPVLFSPVRGTMDAGRLADLILERRLRVRLQLQLHTLLWPDTPRGV
ncbi:MAG TPA: radical SAM protein [Desulfobulbus sp.]|nr:radical SAM protein [Desulfobulbus sp.]